MKSGVSGVAVCKVLIKFVLKHQNAQKRKMGHDPSADTSEVKVQIQIHRDSYVGCSLEVL